MERLLVSLSGDAHGAAHSVVLLAACAAVVAVAGAIRGFTGYGFGIAAVPLLGLILPPDRVVPLVLVLQAVVGLQGVRDCVADGERALVVPIAVGAALATPAGLVLGVWLKPCWLRAGIAACTIGSVLMLLRPPASGCRAMRPPSVLGAGLVAGMANGLAAMPGPPIVGCCLRAGLSDTALRASLVLCFALISAASLACLPWCSPHGSTALCPAVLLSPCVLAGSWAGARLFASRCGRHYRGVTTALLVMMAATALLRSVADWI